MSWRGLPPDTVVDLLAEIRRLREGLRHAVRLLALFGITPEENQVQPLEARSARLWREAIETRLEVEPESPSAV